MAFVVPRDGVTIDVAALSTWAREAMANFKVPRHFRIVDVLPTNASGKVFILDVAQGFLGALERSGSAQWNYARPSEREALMRPPASETPTRIVNPGQALGD
jgi:hypothetical protein